MVIVNLYGAPGAGKSTDAAYVFSQLKMKGINAELVTEFAKDKVWEESKAVFDDQLYIFAKQHFRISRLGGKVDVIVTDSPLLLASFYGDEDGSLGKEFKDLVYKVPEQYPTFNAFIDRVKPYNPAGRFQNEQESDEVSKMLEKFIGERGVFPKHYSGDIEGYDALINDFCSFWYKEKQALGNKNSPNLYKEENTMKRQIRRGVFETNSSSMHSLTVLKRDETYTSEEILGDMYLRDDQTTGEKDCIWHIHEDDLYFGRQPFRALGTFKEKWLYACASLVHEYNDAVFQELTDIALKHIPNLKKIEFPMTIDLFAKKNAKKFRKDKYYQENGKTEKELQEFLSQKEKQWGLKLNYCEDGDWWKYKTPYTGSVDEDILSGFLKREVITIEEFITNKKYVVIQDGDEYGYWSDMKRFGIVNTDIIAREYPRRDVYGCIQEDINEETDQTRGF